MLFSFGFKDTALVLAFLAKVLRLMMQPDWIQSDNGGEFVSAAVQEFCSRFGIKYEFVSDNSTAFFKYINFT